MIGNLPGYDFDGSLVTDVSTNFDVVTQSAKELTLLNIKSISCQVQTFKVIKHSTLAMETPVLLLIFNRPDSAEQVVKAVRSARPSRIYIAADGPRENRSGEAEQCIATRAAVLQQIDWDCELKTLFRTENLGCALAVSSAITWFFQHEEMGIILEDDCLPDTSFFAFCSELLYRYKDDHRIMHISGFNEQTQSNHESSYYFSYYPSLWGWATWRRAWAKYELVPHPTADVEQQIVSTYFYGMTKVAQRWFRDFRHCLEKKSAWGYQWSYAIWKNHGLAITANVPLILNIGFDHRATHTSSEAPKSIRLMKLKSMDKILKHPLTYLPDSNADITCFRNQHYPRLMERIKLRLASILSSPKNLNKIGGPATT